MVDESLSNPSYMLAYLAKETIATAGKYIFRIQMIGDGGNSEVIGPFTIKIDEGEIPFIFPTHLINPDEGLAQIEIQ